MPTRPHRLSPLLACLTLLAGAVLLAACPSLVAPTPTPTPTRYPVMPLPARTNGVPVNGWLGQIFSYQLPTGFDDYFQRQGEARPYGITGLDPDIRQRIAELRDSRRVVRLVGTLYNNVGDVEGRRIVVSLLRVGAEATPSPTATSTPVPATATSTPAATSTPVPSTWTPSPATPTSTRQPATGGLDLPTPTWPPLPTATPTPIVITDWRGEYFDNIGLTGPPASVRNELAVNFDWGDGSPVPEITDDRFSARWTGTFFLTGGDYRFEAYADDGVRVLLDGFLLIDEWHNWRDTIYSSDFLRLSPGYHTITVEYVDYGGRGRIWLRYDPIDRFPQWAAEYFRGTTLLLGDRVLFRNDPDLDFNWGYGSPDPTVPADNFSARWTRTLTLPGGSFRFWVRADDGVRVWLDNMLIHNEWSDGFKEVSAPVSGLASGYHPVRVEYYDRQGLAQIRFWYDYLGPSPGPVPQ